MKKLHSLALLFVSLLALHGCGGSGNDNNFVVTPAAQNGALATNNNVIVANQFVVAAGETRRFSENTTILARENITVSGQINLDPGVSLTLFSQNQLNVSGQIGPAPGVTARGTFDFLGRAIRAQGVAPSFVVLASPGHNVSGTIQGAENQDVFIATYGENRSVTVSGSVKAGSGTEGTSTTDGGRGANVHIGNDEANTAAASSLGGLGAFAGDLASSLPNAEDFDIPNQLTVTGSLEGGTGGKGFTDVSGSNSSLDLGDGGNTPLQAAVSFREFRGGDGGPGGDLLLAAEAYQLNGTIQAGNGGDGGDCGTGNGQDGILEAGQSVLATTGSGGTGGKTSILDTRNVISIPAAVVSVAQGGTPGASRVRAGNGDNGFDGGDTTISPGNAGFRGTVEPENAGGAGTFPTLLCQIVLENGGNGGNGSSINPNGGNGGEVQITVPNSLRSGSTDNRSLCTLDISIRNYSNAGNGFDGCSVDPQVAGGNGGERGARFVLTEELRIDPTLAINMSFNDGDGGDGDGPGFGRDTVGLIDFPPLSRNEVFALDASSFQRGDEGLNCPRLEVFLDLDPNTQGDQLERNFDFDSADTDPNCGTLQAFFIRNGGRTINYTFTPRAPQGNGQGITLSSTSGTINANDLLPITPTFVCQDETTNFEHTFDLVITADGGLRREFVIVFRGTEVDPAPCVTQAVFRNNMTSGIVDIRFQDDNMQVGTDVIVRFGQERTFNEAVPLENLTIMYGSNGPRIGTDIDVPCGSRAVFTLNPDLRTTIVVEPIP